MTNQIIDRSVLRKHYQLMYLMGCVNCNDSIFRMSGRSMFGQREPSQVTPASFWHDARGLSSVTLLPSQVAPASFWRDARGLSSITLL